MDHEKNTDATQPNSAKQDRDRAREAAARSRHTAELERAYFDTLFTRAFAQRMSGLGR